VWAAPTTTLPEAILAPRLLARIPSRAAGRAGPGRAARHRGSRWPELDDSSHWVSAGERCISLVAHGVSFVLAFFHDPSRSGCSLCAVNCSIASWGGKYLCRESRRWMCIPSVLRMALELLYRTERLVANWARAGYRSPHETHREGGAPT